jgi:hypothetical protein
MAPACIHGVANPSTIEKSGAMLECAILLDAIEEQFGDRWFSTFLEFWSDQCHSHLVDEELSALYFARATDALLQGRPNAEDMARLFAIFGVGIKEMTEKGIATFLESQGGPSREDTEVLRTRDGLVRYLARAIPCSCLDEHKKVAKAGPKMGKCFFCRQEGTQVKLLKCSGCKIGEYCSKVCQTADWKDHKMLCNVIAKRPGLMN